MTGQKEPLSFEEWVRRSHPKLTKRLRKKVACSERWQGLYFNYCFDRYGFYGALYAYLPPELLRQEFQSFERSKSFIGLISEDRGNLSGGYIPVPFSSSQSTTYAESEHGNQQPPQ